MLAYIPYMDSMGYAPKIIGLVLMLWFDPQSAMQIPDLGPYNQ